jgi:WD40 repeat protein
MCSVGTYLMLYVIKATFVKYSCLIGILSIITVMQILYCTSLSWSADGSTLYAGYTDGTIRIFKISGFSYSV